MQSFLMTLYILSILSALGVLYLAFFVRQAPKSLFFCYMTLSLFVFNLAYFFEINAHSYDTALMAARMEYLGIPFLVPFLFLFVLEYCSNNKPKRSYIAAILALPTVAALLVMTWPLTDVFYKQLVFETNPSITRLRVTGGVVYYVFFIYSYILALAALGIVLYYRNKRDAQFKKQANTLVLATVLPAAGNIVNVLKLGDPDFDITPILFTVTCILLGYSIFRQGLIMVEPIAKEQIIANMSDGVILVDMHGGFIDANSSAKNLFPNLNTITSGEKISNLPGLRWADSGCETEQEFSVKNDSGIQKYYRTSLNAIKNSGREIGTCIMLYDVTEAKEHLNEVSHMAEHDALTDLINRGTLYSLGKEAFAQFGPQSSAAILMMDIDFFKKFNDTYGHLNGDEVLKSVANCISSNLRLSDIVGRYGGEEFCVFLARVRTEDIFAVAEKLRIGIEKLELQLDGKRVDITISVGVSLYDHERHKDFEAFLADADSAMYEAKKAGRNCVRIHQHSIDT